MRRGLPFVLVLALAAPLFADDKASLLAKEAQFPLEGATSVSGSALDASAGRLYVSHAADVDVIDLGKREKAGAVEGVEKARGIVVLPDLKRGFVASAKKNRLVAFDLVSLQPTKEILVGDSPDGVLHVPSVKEVWTLCPKSNNIVCVDPEAQAPKATIAFEGSPMAAVDVPGKNMVYVGLATPDTIAVVDVRSHKVVGTHPLAPGTDPQAMALDAKDGLVFVGCGNQKFVVFETAGWKLVTSYDIASRCAGVVFDPASGNAFAVCEDQTRTVHVNTPKSLSVLPSLDTDGARSCVLDPKTHRIYVACGAKKDEGGTASVLIFAPK